MKTHPSQRHFAVPVAIVASAHVFLFLGFSVPPKKITPPEKPRIERPEKPIEVVLEPQEVEEHSGPPSVNPSKAGPPVPQIEDTSAPRSFVDIVMPVERIVPREIGAPISLVPTSPGDGSLYTRGGMPSITDLDFAPRATHQLAPFYPQSLRSAGISGTVTVTFVVDPTGHVSDVRAISASQPDFIEPAVRAVGRWKFEPGKLHGHAVSFRMSVPVHFILGE